MAFYDDIQYDTISPTYMNLIKDDMKDKKIIFIHQYIRDIDNDFDREYGPINSWIIGIIFIEKIKDDYIFHMLESDTRSSGASPHFMERFITYPHKQIVKLSKIISMSNESNHSGLFELYYMTAKESKDQILINQMEKISQKIE
jgi:hypothetical protein